MASVSEPVGGDVLLSASSCGLHVRCYELSIVPGPPQLCVPDRAQAIASGMAYAEEAHTDVWLVASPSKPIRLTHARTQVAAVAS